MKGIPFLLLLFLVILSNSAFAQNTVTPQILSPLAFAINESSGLINLATSNSVPAETISFSYSDQTSWDPHPNQTNYNCEAIIAYGGFLYLFSKDWVDQSSPG